MGETVGVLTMTSRPRAAVRILWAASSLFPAVLISAALAVLVSPQVSALLVLPVTIVWWVRCSFISLHLEDRTIVVRNAVRTVRVDVSDVDRIERSRSGPFGRHLNGSAPCLRIRKTDSRSIAIVASWDWPDLSQLQAELEAFVAELGR